MKLKYKRFLIMLLLVCLNVGSFTMVASAASKLSTPVITVSNVAATGKIKVSWKTVKKAVSYKVYRSTDKKKWICISTTKKKSITNTSPVAGKTYYYKVRAIASKSSRNSKYSKIKGIMCDLPRPSISLSTVLDTGKNKVSWESINKAVSYEVYRSKDAKNWGVLGKTSNISWIDATGKPGVKYHYKVKAIASNKNANSAFSLSNYRYCDLARPVVTLSEDEETGKTVISWEPIAGALTYKVSRSTDKKAWTIMTTTSNTSVIHSNATVGKRYYYRVQAFCNASSSTSAYSLVKEKICSPEPETELTYYVSNPTVILYEEANSSSKSLFVPYMSRVEFTEPVEKDGKWYQVVYQGKSYYAWIDDFANKYTKEKSSFSYKGSNSYQQETLDQAVDIALNWKTKYVFGQSEGKQDANGYHQFDCSGFVTYVINGVMQKEIPVYKLTPMVSKMVNAKAVYNAGFTGEFNAKTVELENIQPGDVLIWSLEATNDHCGIYLGNGEFAHSSMSMSDVCIMPLKGMYLDKLSMIRRLIPSKVTPANQVVTIDPASGTSACGVYKTLGNTQKAGTVEAGTKVTVIFNGNGEDSSSQAYIKMPDGTKRFIYSNNLKK